MNNTEEQAVERFLDMRKDDPDISQAAAARIIASDLFVSSQVIQNYLSKHRRQLLAAKRTHNLKRQKQTRR